MSDTAHVELKSERVKAPASFLITASFRSHPSTVLSSAPGSRPSNQGLKLVNFTAQLKRFLWDRGASRG